MTFLWYCNTIKIYELKYTFFLFNKTDYNSTHLLKTLDSEEVYEKVT